MKALARLATLAAVATALAVPTSAQIISTSLPTAKAGGARDKFSMHIMATPFAKWDYKEVYVNVDGESLPPLEFWDLGLINGKPNSDFMAAADMAFALGNSNWSITAGGWYNKIGTNDFNFDGTFAVMSGNDVLLAVGETAQIPVDLTLTEGHLGVFYKSVGIQGGIVHTSSKSNGDWKNVSFEGGTPADYSALVPFDSSTNDWTTFGVFRTARERWGFSIGAGAYFKEGVTNSPLRLADNKVVFSGFVTGNVAVFKGLGIDVSYWYIGKTDDVQDFKDLVGADVSSPSDAQSRFTIGIGYSF